MNHNLEEKKIRQLFLELRQQDESEAPPFPVVLNSALTSTNRLSPVWFNWRMAAVIAMLILVSGVSFLLFRQSFTTQQGNTATTAEAFSVHHFARQQPSSTNFPNPAQPVLAGRQATKEIHKAVYRKPFSHSPQQTNLLISKWQSPTDFLLRTPGAEWLRNLPQINESILEIKNLLPDSKNEW